jgi:hypothetical protein
MKIDRTAWGRLRVTGGDRGHAGADGAAASCHRGHDKYDGAHRKSKHAEEDASTHVTQKP